MLDCPVTFAGSADMAIFGSGRRPPIDPGKYIVPPEFRDDPKNAAFLARIGAKPDDPSNLRVTDVGRVVQEMGAWD